MSGAEAAAAKELREAALRLVELGAAERWRGPDPYDGLWSSWPRPLVAGRRRRQAIIQLHARSPFDLRRLYRRRPHSLVPKAPALLGQAAVRLWCATGDSVAKGLAEDALATLAADTSCGEEAWGYPWDTQTRWSHYPGGSPNLVATAFVAAALAEGAEALERPEWRQRAERAARWALRSLFLEGDGYFAYHEHSERLVHNASLLGAALVHDLAADKPGAADAVRRATVRTLDAQHPDGTWPYGEGPGLEWADSFHSGYVLASLRRLRGVDPRIPTAIERGAAAYLTFFDPDGRAHLWRDKRHPEDSHSAGTGLTVLSALADDDIVPRTTLTPITRRTLTHMIDCSGHAIFRRNRLGPTHVHYPRWCDGPVALGLATAAPSFDRRTATLGVSRT